MPEHHFITGVAGFIGSQLADSLLAKGHVVSGVDDLSLGREENLTAARGSGRFHFKKADIRQVSDAQAVLKEAVAARGPVDVLWHLAANSDIAAGVADGNVDFTRTLGTTFAILEAAKVCGVRRFAFSSTSAVYGERGDLLTEESGPLLPISNYGATKLASEALLSAAAETFLERIWIFRFPNVIGPRATHGALYDFVRRLVSRPPALRVLGDGSQTKPYLHVSELVEAMQFILSAASAKRNVYNIGPEEAGTSVAFMAEQTIARVAPRTPIAYTGGDRGWVGDVPRFRYSTSKLARLGWSPRLSSAEAVVRAIDEIASEQGCQARMA
jgi:UDP-glucose 4-epimerase